MPSKEVLAHRMSLFGKIGLALLLIYAALKGFKGGNDINVFLHAGSQFLNGEDLYTSNPFNRYLYSPLFAALMAPLSMLPWEVARIIWALMNIALSYRCYRILRELIPIEMWNSRASWIWKTGLLFLSFNAFNHNLVLGQMTVIILWMTMEGLYQIFFGKEWKGGGLLALGMNIKIIPIIAIAYIFFKGKIRASFITGAFLIASLVLPALFVGFQENISLHEKWLNEINPSGSRYAWEENTGCVSLNCILPTFFLPVTEESNRHLELDTLLFAVEGNTLVYMIHGARLLVFIGLIFLIFKQWNKREEKLSLWREWSLLLIASLLILPHQMKYSMLYAIPAIMLLWFSFTSGKYNGIKKWTILSALAGAVIISLMGRDVIGSVTVDFLDHFRFMGITLLVIYSALLITWKEQEKIEF
jgi:hypothetical protein